MVQNDEVRRPQSPRVAEECDVNIHSRKRFHWSTVLIYKRGWVRGTVKQETNKSSKILLWCLDCVIVVSTVLGCPDGVIVVSTVLGCPDGVIVVSTVLVSWSCLCC
ncbi:hypothetical protein TNCV_4743681 [Trichonephila clavipes]|nr:hypothetical protein TNCV_4743681 [Trichonephila clavipes]